VCRGTKNPRTYRAGSVNNLTIIERSVKGKGFGFDFWLGSIDDADSLFQRKAR